MKNSAVLSIVAVLPLLSIHAQDWPDVPETLKTSPLYEKADLPAGKALASSNTWSSSIALLGVKFQDRGDEMLTLNFNPTSSTPFRADARTKLSDCNLNWTFGSRGTLEYRLDNQSWITGVTVTTAHPHGKSVQESSFGIVFEGIVPVFGDKIQVEKDLLYLMFEWNVGQIYFISPHFSLRPKMGVEGGIINRKERWNGEFLTPITFFNAPSNLLIASCTATKSEKFAGIGPSVGFVTQWYIPKLPPQYFLSVFFDGSLSGLGGYTKFKSYEDVEQLDSLIQYVVDILLDPPLSDLGSLLGVIGNVWRTDQISQFLFGFKYLTGLKFSLYRPAYTLNLELGYQFEYWFGFHLFDIQSAFFSSISSGAIQMQGGFASIGVDY